VAFGLWHLVPTAAALDLNGVATGRRARAVALAGAVVVTAVAGAGLCLLRLATGSLVAPALVHASATSTATVVAGVLQAGGPRWAPLG
jgi:membrane protease YdiL (CAAX protease family)